MDLHCCCRCCCCCFSPLVPRTQQFRFILVPRNYKLENYFYILEDIAQMPRSDPLRWLPSGFPGGKICKMKPPRWKMKNNTSLWVLNKMLSNPGDFCRNRNNSQRQCPHRILTTNECTRGKLLKLSFRVSITKPCFLSFLFIKSMTKFVIDSHFCYISYRFDVIFLVVYNWL